MKNKGNFLEIVEKLPFGAKIKIAQKTGLTTKTVTKVLKGNGGRVDTVKKVAVAVKEFVKEYNELTNI